MNEIKITATREQLIYSLKSTGISRRIDNMNLHLEYNYILLDDAKAAAKVNHYKGAKTFIKCKVFITRKPGMYGHQFMAAIWCNADGNWWQASGAITKGYGYCKVSTAIENAFTALGITDNMIDHFGGTGLHERALEALAAKLAGQKSWFSV